MNKCRFMIMYISLQWLCVPVQNTWQNWHYCINLTQFSPATIPKTKQISWVLMLALPKTKPIKFVKLHELNNWLLIVNSKIIEHIFTLIEQGNKKYHWHTLVPHVINDHLNAAGDAIITFYCQSLVLVVSRLVFPK